MKTGCVFWEGEGRVMCFWSSVWVQATPQFSWGALPLPPTLPCPSRFGHVFSSVTWPMTESLWRWTSKPHPQRKNSHCASHVTLELWPFDPFCLCWRECIHSPAPHLLSGVMAELGWTLLDTPLHYRLGKGNETTILFDFSFFILFHLREKRIMWQNCTQIAFMWAIWILCSWE